jgi:sugar/nucleoside kinase (ribokinase family)
LYAKLCLDRLSRILARANILFLYQQQLEVLLGVEESSMSVHDQLDRFFHWRREKEFNQPMIVVVKKTQAAARGVVAPEQLDMACGRTTLETVVPPQARATGANVRQLLDTTGAGDALAAGVLLGLLEERTLHECADFAYLMAVQASRRFGARDGLPSAKQFHLRKRSWFVVPASSPRKGRPSIKASPRIQARKTQTTA